MTAADPLISYLRERLAEEEAAARVMLGAVWPPRVLVASRDDVGDVPPGCVAVDETGAPKGFRRVWCDGTTDHGWHASPGSVEVWGPDVAARVLAEVEAKRAILDRLEAVRREDAAGWNDYSEWIQGARGPELVRTTNPKERDGLEIAVRLLAQMYVARDDFRPEWMEML